MLPSADNLDCSLLTCACMERVVTFFFSFLNSFNQAFKVGEIIVLVKQGCYFTDVLRNNRNSGEIVCLAFWLFSF